MLGVGFWVLGFGCWVLGVGCWELGVGCWVLGLDWNWMESTGFRAQDSGHHHHSILQPRFLLVRCHGRTNKQTKCRRKYLNPRSWLVYS